MISLGHSIDALVFRDDLLKQGNVEVVVEDTPYDPQASLMSSLSLAVALTSVKSCL